MAKKPSPAELKKQGEELSKQVAEIRKKDVNFAMVLGKEGVAFHTDRKKNPDILWRGAKAEAGGAKGAKGVVSMSGKVMVLDADDPSSVPGPLLKAAKKHFAERGVVLRIVLKDEEEPAGDEDEDVDKKAAAKAKKPAGEEPQEAALKKEATPRQEADPKKEEPAAEAEQIEKKESDTQADNDTTRADALRESLIKDFKAMKPDLDLAKAAQNPGLKKKIAGLARMFVDQIDKDVKKAHSVVGLLQTTIKSAKDKGDLGASEGAAANGASVARRKKLAAMERGIDKLLERLA